MARIPLSTDASASGFALLAALAADAIAHGTAVPPPPAGRLGRHVAFVCASESWMVPMSEIAAVVRAPRVTHVPGTREWLRGLAFIEGRVIPLIDLAGFLGVPDAGSASTVLVLARPPGAGLVVDQVLGLVEPDQGDSMPVEVDPGSPARTWSCARVQLGSRLLNQFDLGRLLVDPAFCDVTKGVPDR